MHITMQTITPADAKDLLGANTNNRKLRADRVELYARHMTNGDWAETGEPIIIAADGELLNGQHRLHACVLADVAFTTAVVRDADPNVFQFLDSGLPRAAGDLVAQMGVKHSALTAAGARIAVGYRTGAITTTNQMTVHANRVEILREIAAHHDLYARHVKQARAAFSGGHNQSGLLAFLVLTDTINGEGSAGEFVDGLVSGANLDAGDVRLAFQRLLVGPYRPKSGVVYLGTVTRAYQTYLAGGTRKSLHTWKAGTPFPSIPELRRTPRRPLR